MDEDITAEYHVAERKHGAEKLRKAKLGNIGENR
jgi:hypothetical protein